MLSATVQPHIAGAIRISPPFERLHDDMELDDAKGILLFFEI